MHAGACSASGKVSAICCGRFLNAGCRPKQTSLCLCQVDDQEKSFEVWQRILERELGAETLSAYVGVICVYIHATYYIIHTGSRLKPYMVSKVCLVILYMYIGFPEQRSFCTC